MSWSASATSASRSLGRTSALSSRRITAKAQVRTDAESGIVNDPNSWSAEVNNPRYIVELLKRVVTVGVETNRTVMSLPSLAEPSS
jgi:predicted helicase